MGEAEINKLACIKLDRLKDVPQHDVPKLNDKLVKKVRLLRNLRF